MKEIRFYLKDGEQGWLSNFAPYPITVEGIVWPTVEHYYQAQKFPHDKQHADRIHECGPPAKAWHLGNRPDHPPCPDWEQKKESVMTLAVRTKFRQHPSLRERLAATGDSILIEGNPNDCFWGAGKDGTGRNVLGRILMQVRDELSESSNRDSGAEIAQVGTPG